MLINSHKFHLETRGLHELSVNLSDPEDAKYGNLHVVGDTVRQLRTWRRRFIPSRIAANFTLMSKLICCTTSNYVDIV